MGLVVDTSALIALERAGADWEGKLAHVASDELLLEFVLDPHALPSHLAGAAASSFHRHPERAMNPSSVKIPARPAPSPARQRRVVAQQAFTSGAVLTESQHRSPT